jgi:hypothetical protein
MISNDFRLVGQSKLFISYFCFGGEDKNGLISNYSLNLAPKNKANFLTYFPGASER